MNENQKVELLRYLKYRKFKKSYFIDNSDYWFERTFNVSKKIFNELPIKCKKVEVTVDFCQSLQKWGASFDFRGEVKSPIWKNSSDFTLYFSIILKSYEDLDSSLIKFKLT